MGLNISDFEKKLAEKISKNILKDFPDDFILDQKFHTIQLPGKPLLKGSELFGNYEIIDTEGNQILSSENLDMIKFVLYSNRTYPKSIKVLSEGKYISQAVREYEIHLDEIIKMIKNDIIREFPDYGKIENSISKIFRLLNLYRY